MKAQTLFLAVMAAISLAACSSSGGGSGVKANGNGTSSSASNSASNGTSNGASNNKPIVKEDTDGWFDLNHQKTTFKQTLKNGEPVSINEAPEYSASYNDGDNFKTIQVGKQTFTMNSDKKYTGDFVGTEKDGVGEYKVAPDTAYARYGFTIDHKTADWTLFYQGQPTDVAKMPTAGSVVYVGRAFALNPKEINRTDMDNEGFYGRSMIEANFDTKKVNGGVSWWNSNLNGAKLPNDTIFSEANIRGNTFSGNTFKGDYLQGRFYGPNAENVAGSFADEEQGLHGVFGGVKQ